MAGDEASADGPPFLPIAGRFFRCVPADRAGDALASPAPASAGRNGSPRT